MPDYVTGSGYRIAPVLGIVRPGFRADHQRRRGRRRLRGAAALPDGPGQSQAATAACGTIANGSSTTMPYGDRRIWGVTAGIIRTLYERLYA